MEKQTEIKKSDQSVYRTIINTPSNTAKNTFFYILETGRTRTMGKSSSAQDNFDSFLLAAVISGNGKLTIENESLCISKGDCFFIRCKNSYSYKSTDSEPLEILWIYFNGATSVQYYDYFLTQSKNVFRPASFDKVTSAINGIIKAAELRDSHSEAVTSGFIAELLTIAVTSDNSSGQYDNALKHKLMAINEYIEEHFADDISLEKLSSEFYISKFYLTREYKKIFGQTIFQHIINARINYGKQLLRFSDKSIEEISHLCGFNDQSYFARQFKKSENLTCFSYRKKWRDK